jgi:predicted metalloenzyme YecM
MQDINLQKEYEIFMEEMAKRSKLIGLDIDSFPIDHVCYRAKDIESFNIFLELFKSLSVIYTVKTYHERKFYTFFLKDALTYKNISSYVIEYSEPGGSDTYDNGFQHLELLTNKSYEDILDMGSKDVKDLVFEGKFGDERYLKWNDKKVIKVKSIPLYYISLSDEESDIIV